MSSEKNTNYSVQHCHGSTLSDTILQDFRKNIPNFDHTSFEELPHLYQCLVIYKSIRLSTRRGINMITHDEIMDAIQDDKESVKKRGFLYRCVHCKRQSSTHNPAAICKTIQHQVCPGVRNREAIEAINLYRYWLFGYQYHIMQMEGQDLTRLVVNRPKNSSSSPLNIGNNINETFDTSINNNKNVDMRDGGNSASAAVLSELEALKLKYQQLLEAHEKLQRHCKTVEDENKTYKTYLEVSGGNQQKHNNIVNQLNIAMDKKNQQIEFFRRENRALKIIVLQQGEQLEQQECIYDEDRDAITEAFNPALYPEITFDRHDKNYTITLPSGNTFTLPTEQVESSSPIIKESKSFEPSAPLCEKNSFLDNYMHPSLFPENVFKKTATARCN
jgi:hypothetical protein